MFSFLDLEVQTSRFTSSKLRAFGDSWMGGDMEEEGDQQCACHSHYQITNLHVTANRELREVIELPLLNPELFLRVGIKPPKGVLLYGPPGTGKTLLARAVASTLECNFLKVVSSAIVDKYIGESARLIREMFGM